MKKATVINVLTELPKEFNLDDFFDKLVVIEKIDAGLQDGKEGKTYTHDEVKSMAAKC